MSNPVDENDIDYPINLDISGELENEEGQISFPSTDYSAIISALRENNPAQSHSEIFDIAKSALEDLFRYLNIPCQVEIFSENLLVRLENINIRGWVESLLNLFRGLNLISENFHFSFSNGSSGFLIHPINPERWENTRSQIEAALSPQQPAPFSQPQPIPLWLQREPDLTPEERARALQGDNAARGYLDGRELLPSFLNRYLDGTELSPSNDENDDALSDSSESTFGLERS